MRRRSSVLTPYADYRKRTIRDIPIFVCERMARYILAAERGEDEERAFQAAFGMSFQQLQGKVASYHRSIRIPGVALPRHVFSPDRGAEVREVAPGEMGVRLGMLALEFEKVDVARDRFERVLAADPDSARAHAGLGVAYSREGLSDRAEAHQARALELAPDDYENHLDRAKSLHDAADRDGRLELLPRAREHYARAIELAPEIPEGHLRLGATYLLTDEDPAPGLRAAEHARRLLPGHPEVHLVLARLYRHAGRRAAAILAARRAALWSQGEIQEHARALLAELGDVAARADP
jgi:tetratricopeptide (TPR) repeat protein